MKSKNYTIVTSSSQLRDLYDHIAKHDYFAFDTETTGLNVRKDKIIGLSVSGEEGVSFYLPFLTWDKTLDKLIEVNPRHVVLDVLNRLSEKQLLMWNASYDIRITKNDFKVDLTESLLADVMLMKHTVAEEGEFALKKVAILLQKELGLDMETAANEEQIILKANVAANGGTTTKGNFEMFKADLEVMGQYAAADADLTLRLGHLFQKNVEREEMEDFFFDIEAMPLYKYVTIPMEEKGIRLDLPLILQTQKEIQKDIETLEKSILSQLNGLPSVQEWLKQRALADHPASHTGSFAQALCRMYSLPLPLTKSGKYSLTAKTIETLPDSSFKKFLQGDLTALFPEELENISMSLADNTINISSKQQMGHIAFNCLGYRPLSTTDKGAPQFDDDMIKHLVEAGEPWARDLSNYNKLIKQKGTSIDRFLDEQEDGIFYPSFGQHKTISGRFGSNLQQLPRPKEEGELDEIVLKYNNLIRQFFISGPGRSFIDVDYESLEPHVFAHVSGDEGLRDIFRKGHDFYSTIAIATEKLVGVSADKKAPNYLGKVNKPKRQAAKAYSLGIPYGMTAFALGKTLGISTKEAEVLVEGYLSGFPKLKEWMEKSKAQAQIFGFVKSEAGRTRHLPKVKDIHAIHKNKLLDYSYKRALEKRYPKHLVQMWYMDYKNGLNNSLNFQIQSLGASIVNRAAIAINKKLKELNIDAWVCFQCHDQIIVNAPEELASECAKIVQEIMENVYPLSLKLKAPACVGKNFKDAH